MIRERWDRWKRKVRRAILREDPEYYDMYENRGERYFGRLYLHHIRRALERLGKPPLTILDAGCSTGRLAIPLAEDGHRVTGVDTSGVALRRARRHAAAAGVEVRWLRANLERWLPTQPVAAYDAVVCTEVLYLRPTYRTLLAGLLRVLKPGGVACCSHRPTSYYVAEALQQHDEETARRIRTSSEGLFRGSYYNWQDRRGLERLYGDYPVSSVTIAPIGPRSQRSTNFEGLDAAGQEALFQADLAAEAAAPDFGRYFLVIARKRPA